MQVVCTDAPDHLLKNAESMDEKNVENKLIRLEKCHNKKIVLVVNGRPSQVPVVGNGGLSVFFSTTRS